MHTIRVKTCVTIEYQYVKIRLVLFIPCAKAIFGIDRILADGWW